MALTYKVNCEVQGMHYIYLLHIFCSTKERADVVIYRNKGTGSCVVSAFEVQSSPMSYTITKAVYFAANLIRLLKKTF